MKVLVAGGTGVVGRPLVARLRAAGHDALSLGRTAADVRCDALDASAVMRAVTSVRPDVIVHQLTAIPSSIRPRKVDVDFALTNRLRIEGTAHLIAAARKAGVRRFVAQSVAFLCAPGATLADEREPIVASGIGAPLLCAALASVEQQVAGAGFEQALVCRYGLFWGPGTTWDAGGAMATGVQKRKLPIVGGGSARWSLVHVDDAAEGTHLLIERGVSGVVHLVEDAPPTAAEALTFAARRAGAKPPWRIPTWLGRLGAGRYGVFMMTAMRGASNAHARALGWTPRHRFIDA